jgi:hexosaminidase
MLVKWLWAFCILCIGCKGKAQEIIKGELLVLPKPVSMMAGNGTMTLNDATHLLVDSFPSFDFDPFAVFREVFQKKSGYPLKDIQSLSNKHSVNGAIVIHYSIENTEREGYQLEINTDAIHIYASGAHGIFYALQTIRQMSRMDAREDATDNKRQWILPAVRITDYPQFSYRGMHLDVVRHFMPLDFVKKYIDQLAYYKMNRFHWHLTDDQGWRIEIKRFPRLQEVAAWRDKTLIGHYRETPDRYDSTRYGGYFTQDEIKEVVAYASMRGVTIIPEIEMPGHAQAALTAYPKLGCTSAGYEVAGTWGVFDEVFCPKESTFTFLQSVLDEVIGLFPSPYIHIGGDECPKTRWKSCLHCQSLMQREGLKDEHELQSYFITRIEKYLNGKGRMIIGWDEILEGGLAPNATVMSWRGIKGGIEAARTGHDVIMTPGSHCYFDHYQADPATEPLAFGGLTTIEKVYSFNPVPADLSAEEAKHILGAQANLWTEYIDSPEKAEYMAYPRAIALAEVLWNYPASRDFTDFANRLYRHLPSIDGMDVHYCKNFIDPTIKTFSTKNGLAIIWTSAFKDWPVYYTRDTTSHQWMKASVGDTTIIADGGLVFYKGASNKIRSINYAPSKAVTAEITSAPAPDSQYPGADGVRTLINGLAGNVDFNGTDWCAWKGKEFNIDLRFPDPTRVDSVGITFLHSPGAWIHQPVSILIKGSSDGKTYVDLASWQSSPTSSGRHKIVLDGKGKTLKQLRIHVLPLLAIPEGKPGAGRSAWAFFDEVSIY